LLAIFVGIAVIFRRGSPVIPTTSTNPAAIRLEELVSAEELFEMAGQKAVVIKYFGGEVEFWIEIESQGKKQRVVLPEKLADDNHRPAPNQSREGYFLWVRNQADDVATEIWKLACRRDFITTDKFGVEVSSPVGDVAGTRSRENRKSSTVFTSQPVQVWGSASKREIAALTSTSTSIPTPLPADREVCIKEFREKRLRPARVFAAMLASTLGLLASPQGGPLLGASALPPARMDETIDQHTIKVMCKIVPTKG
jgi:hypothetical protein